MHPYKCGLVSNVPLERLNGIQEVSGSIPLISTNEHLKSKDFRCFSVSNQLISSNMNTFV